MWKRHKWRACCVFVLFVASGISADDGHKRQPERYSTLVEQTIQLHPSEVTFEVPAAWAVDCQTGWRRMLLARDELNRARNDADLGHGAAAGAVLNFGDCALQVETPDPRFWLRAYVTDQPADTVLKRIREKVVKAASKLAASKRDVTLHESMEGPWQHLRIETGRWFEDYSMKEDFDFYLRPLSEQRLLVMATTSWGSPAAGPPDDDPTVAKQRQALLQSVVVPEAPKNDRDRLGAEQTIPTPQQKGHQHASPVRVVGVRFLIGAGLCTSCYCGREIQVSPRQVTLLVRPFRDCQQQNPQKYRELKVDADLSSKHWRELEQLIDHDTLFALPDTIGCPGCSDGPTELVEVKFSDHTKKSVYYESAPREISALSEKLLALEAKLERELPPHWRDE